LFKFLDEYVSLQSCVGVDGADLVLLGERPSADAGQTPLEESAVHVVLSEGVERLVAQTHLVERERLVRLPTLPVFPALLLLELKQVPLEMQPSGVERFGGALLLVGLAVLLEFVEQV